MLWSRHGELGRMSAGSARLVTGPGGGRVQAVFMCACGSIELAARGMCPRCLARQHHDLEHFGGYREQVLERDCWTCRGCFYRPEQKDRDYIVVHHRIPGLSKPECMISFVCGLSRHRRKAAGGAELVAPSALHFVARAA
jgi:hypothetical protein